MIVAEPFTALCKNLISNLSELLSRDPQRAFYLLLKSILFLLQSFEFSLL